MNAVLAWLRRRIRYEKDAEATWTRWWLWVTTPPADTPAVSDFEAGALAAFEAAWQAR